MKEHPACPNTSHPALPEGTGALKLSPMESSAIHVLVLLVFQYMGIKITPAPRFHLGQLLVNIASVAQMVATMSLLVHLVRLAHLVHLVCITKITLRNLRYILLKVTNI